MENHIQVEVNEQYRIIAISDIHGGYEPLKRLIQRIELRDEDYLVILGDFIQKGAATSRQTIVYIQELQKRERTIVLSGNHEKYISYMLSEAGIEAYKEHVSTIEHPCIFKEWKEVLKKEDEEKNLKINFEDVLGLREAISNRFKDEINYLRELPISVTIGGYFFVHAGINKTGEVDETSDMDMVTIRSFMDQGHESEKTIVVGHWPVHNYRTTEFNGKVYINEKKKIIAIDGGYGVKEVGQINALTITENAKYRSFNSLFEDDFEEYEVIEDREYDEAKVLLNWNDSDFVVVEKRDEFSLCRKVRTGESFLMKNEFIIYNDLGATSDQNYISEFHNVVKGDKVRLIDIYGDYCYVKYFGKVGWVEAAALDLERIVETEIIEAEALEGGEVC